MDTDKQFEANESGLYEEDVFRLLADYELSRAQRYPSPVSLLHISLNLDGAKSNIVGPIKQFFSGILNTSLRISDIPAHLGNDFLVLLPSTDEIGAQSLARRLMSRLQGAHNFSDGNTYQFVAQAGIATHPGGRGITVEKLFQKAELALQEAKKAGPYTYKQYTNEEEN